VRSPARPICGGFVQNVPFAVLADVLHCPGGPKMAQCFTENGLGFQAATVSDATFKVRQILQSCYARDYKQIARLGFTALPKPNKRVSLNVKTKAGASAAQARTICAHASIAAKWYGYDRVRVSVAAGTTVRC
jgi:hypothetical protein